MPLLIALLLLIGLGLLWGSRRRQAAAGLPPGRVVYLDTETLGRLETPLYDPSSDLTGRPDYLVRDWRGLIPVEVKSGRAPLRPYASHVLQLAAYGVLVKAAHAAAPPYGIVKYADRAFAVDFTPALENQVLDLLADMRRALHRAPDRSHDSPARCHACGFREICDQALD